MPYRIPACAGKPYRPSNGTEGMMFEEEFCFKCRKNDPDKGCDIYLRAFAHQEEDPEYPTEWTHDDEGCPKCTAFEPKEEP